MGCAVLLPAPCPGQATTIDYTKGDSKTITIQLGRDLTGYIVTFYLKPTATSSTILLTKVGTITDVANGVVTFEFVAADFASIPAGFYWYTIVIDGPTTETVMEGQFVLHPFEQTLVPENCAFITLALTQKEEWFSIKIRDSNGVLRNPTELKFELLDFNDNLLQSTVYPDALLVNPEAGIFIFKGFTTNRAGDYLIIWTYRFENEEPVSVIKNVRFVTPAMWRMIPEVLSYVDKSRKAVGKPIAFTSADVAVYIQNALRDFNATTPSTNLLLEDLDTLYGIYKQVLVQGSIIQALIAQGLLAVDQDFIYNDNGIAINIDHHSKLLSWHNALLQDYTNKKMQYKMNFFSGAVYARTIAGNAFATGFSKIPPGLASRFRGWI